MGIKRMMPQIYDAIEQAVANGVPTSQLALMLVRNGWPVALVNEAVDAWLVAHGRSQKRTDFKKWLKKYKSRAFGAMVSIVMISVLASSLSLLRPWPTKIMVDSVFGNIPAPGPLQPFTHTPKLILLTSLLTILIFVAGFIVSTLKDYFVLRLGFWLNRQIKFESLRHILHLPLYHQERLAKGDYVYRQNTLTNSLSDLVLDTTASITQSFIMIVGILIIMFTFSVNLTLISVVLIPFLFILIRLFGPRLGKISQTIAQVTSRVSSTVNESVDNTETIQSFNLQDKQVSKVDSMWRHNYKLTMRGLLLGRAYRFGNSLLIILATSAVMYFGGSAALHGQITLGQLLIFMTYMGYLLGPVESIAIEIAARNQKLIDVSRVYEVLSDHEGIEHQREGHRLPLVRGQIQFQNVTYNYKDAPVLKDINLVIEPGRKVGIIGPSGAGKTTLLKMLPLFIEPTRGRILIDNVDIQSVALSDLRQKVAWISQSPQLFAGSILENLTDGDITRQISPQEVEKAVDTANVGEFLGKLPKGYATDVGENGNFLSGGQKQRVAIARGLIKNAPIVCMDEPTAALDSKSENYIRDALPQVLQNKTVLLVTHRRALLSLMDDIYVVDNGQLRKVEEMGGLDAYLSTVDEVGVNKNAADEEEKLKEAQRQILEEQKIVQLAAENKRLQEKISSGGVGSTDTGVISINH